MITQAYLNSEIDLAKRIFIYYSDKLLDKLSVAERDRTPWYIDSLQLDYFLSALLSLTLIDGVLYLGSEIVEPSYLEGVGQSVREFLNAELRQILYLELDEDDIIKDGTIPTEPPTVIVIGGSTYGWRHWDIVVTSEAQTVVPLPFNISQADSNSLTVTVNDQDPDHLTAMEQEGCTIVGRTLYWHNYYDLHIGDILVIIYQQINSSV